MEIMPVEIIENILCCENVSITDVVNFSLTNSYYYNVVRNHNTMWKRKYLQTWPEFSEFFKEKDPEFCWYEEIRYVYYLKRRTRKILAKMSVRLYKRCQLFGSDFKLWIEICDENPRTCNYLIHDLMNIISTEMSIKDVPIDTSGNRTLQYYALKVLKFLMHFQLTKEWLAYSALPPRQRTMEKGIFIASRWCRSLADKSWKDISKTLDVLAEKVKEKLKIIDPKHPIFAVPEEDLKKWRDENIEGNKYDVEHCRNVVEAFESVFGFTHALEFDIIDARHMLLCKEVLATKLIQVCGLHNGVLFMYESVSRRLGLKYRVLQPFKGRGQFRLLFSDVFNSTKGDMTQENQLFVAETDEFVNDVLHKLKYYIYRGDTLHDVRGQLRSNLDFFQLLQNLTPVTISPAIFMLKCYVDRTNYSTTLLHKVMKRRIFNLNVVRRTMKDQIKDINLTTCFVRCNTCKKVAWKYWCVIERVYVLHAIGWLLLFLVFIMFYLKTDFIKS